MNALVVYFTRTGNTKALAEALAKEMDCDIEEIVDNKKRTGVIGSAGAYLAPINKKTTIKKVKAKVSDYDLVIIGTPVWWYTNSPATNEFMKMYKGKIKKAALFYTCDVDKGVNSERDFKKDLGKKATITYGFTSGAIKNGSFKKKMKKFAKEVQ